MAVKVCPLCNGKGTRPSKKKVKERVKRESGRGDTYFVEIEVLVDVDTTCTKCGGERIIG